jgi:hypothetical protein
MYYRCRVNLRGGQGDNVGIGDFILAQVQIMLDSIAQLDIVRKNTGVFQIQIVLPMVETHTMPKRQS